MSYITGSVSNFQSASPGLYGNTPEPAPVSSAAPSGPAGGVLTGTYPNPGLSLTALGPGVAPGHSFVGSRTTIGMTTEPTIFAISLSAGALTGDNCTVKLNASWHGVPPMGGNTLTGYATMQFEFDVGTTVAGANYTITVDMPNLWAAMGMPLAWNGAQVGLFAFPGLGFLSTNISTTGVVPPLVWTDADHAQFAFGAAAALGINAKCPLMVPLGATF